MMMEEIDAARPGVQAPKILVLADSTGWGGAERAAVTLAGYWASCGAEVYLYSGTGLEAPRWNFYPTPAGVKRRSLEFNHDVVGIAKLWEELSRMRRLLSEIRATNADVVIGSATVMAVRVAMARLCYGKRFLAVGWEHTNYLNIPSLGHRVIRRLMYRFLDRLVLLTERDQKCYQGIAKSVVIENALSVDGGVNLRRRNFTFRVMAAGRLTTVKGFDLLLEIAEKVNRSDQRVRFDIFGEGDERDNIERQIATLGLEGVVRLCGQKADIAAAYEETELFILTSRYEGFPLAMIEAMSFGLPVVSFDCPTGPREILGNHENSGLVPAGDTQAFADMILRLFEEHGLYEELSRRNAELVRRYRIPEISKKWDNLLGFPLSESWGSAAG